MFSNKRDGTAEDSGSFPSQESGNDDDDDDDEDTNDDFFPARLKPGTTWSSPTNRRSASRGDLPRWNKVGMH